MTNRMKRLLSGIFLVVVGMVLTACGGQEAGTPADGSDQAAGSEDILYIGMEAAYAPYNWTQNDDSNGAVPIDGTDQFANGYDVQVAKRIGEALGREVRVVKTAWEGLIPALQSDKIDLIIAGMTPTPERAEAIDFTDSYYDIVFTIVTQENSEYAGGTSVNDYAGARLTAQQGTAHYNMLEQFPGANIQQALTEFGTMRVALQSDKIDGYISEMPEAISASQAIPGFTYSEITDIQIPEGDADYLAIGVKKGNETLRDQVNQALAALSDADRQAIMDEAIANQPAQGE